MFFLRAEKDWKKEKMWFENVYICMVKNAFSPIRLQRFQISYISKVSGSINVFFLRADIEWRKIKVDLKIFIGQVKNAIGESERIIPESECIIPESTMS